MTFDELDMFLRNLSSQDISENGLGTYLIYNQLKLLTQLYSRKKLLTAQAATLGQIEYESDGQFWFYSKDGQSIGAIIRALKNQFGLIFTGDDRFRIEGTPGGNRAAVLGDL